MLFVLSGGVPFVAPIIRSPLTLQAGYHRHD